MWSATTKQNKFEELVHHVGFTVERKDLYNFLVSIRYRIIYIIVLFLTVLYDNITAHNNKCTYSHIYVYDL